MYILSFDVYTTSEVGKLGSYEVSHNRTVQLTEFPSLKFDQLVILHSLTRWKNVLEKRVECMRFYFHLNLALEARLHSLCSNCITGFRMMASTISCRERRKNRILMQLGYLSMLPLNLSNIIFVVMGIFGNCVTCLRGIM